MGTERRLRHIYGDGRADADEGNVIAAYCEVYSDDFGVDFVVADKDAILRSKHHPMSTYSLGTSKTWIENFPAMARKTAIRIALKRYC